MILTRRKALLVAGAGALAGIAARRARGMIFPGGAVTAGSSGQTFDYYISPTGSDSNPGTLTQPWSISAINNNRSTYAGKKVGIIGDQGQYANCYIACGSPSLNGKYTIPLLRVADGSSLAPTLIQSCNSSGAPAGPHIPGTTAAYLYGGLTDANNSGSNAGSAVIGNNGPGYVQIVGLEITGFNSFGVGAGSWGGPTSAGIVIASNYIHGCNTSAGSGNNSAGITVRGSVGCIVENNYITDNFDSSNRNSGMEFWQSVEPIARYNSIIAVNSSHDISMAIGLKNVNNSQGNIYNNYCDLSISGGSNGVMAFDLDNNGSGTPNITYCRNNIILCPSGYAGCYWGLAGITDANSGETQVFANNTVMGAGTGWFRNGAALTFSAYNNIHGTLTGGGYGHILNNVSEPALIDYNCYATGSFSSSFVPNGTDGSSGHTGYSSLSAWAAAIGTNQPSCVGQDAHSAQHNPSFVGTGTYASRYKISSGDSALTAGSTDGTTSGTACQQGAWGGIDTDSGGPVTQIGCSWLQV